MALELNDTMRALFDKAIVKVLSGEAGPKLSFPQWLEGVRIENVQTHQIVPFELWPYLMERAEAWDAGTSEVILKSRQQGFSWEAVSFAVYKALTPHSNVLMLSQGQTESDEMIRKAAFVAEHLKNPIKIKRATQSFLEFENGSTIRALPSTPRAGRSFTASLVLVDEAALHPYAEENFAAYYPTIADGGQVIMFSTSQGPQGFFYNQFQSAEHPVFVPWYARPDRDQEWKRQTIARFGEARFKREYPETIAEAFAASEGLALDFDVQRHVRQDHPVPWNQTLAKVAGVDPGGDDPTAVVILGAYRKADGIYWHQYDELYRSGTVTFEDMIEFMYRYGVDYCVGDFGDKSPYAETFRRQGIEAHGAKKNRGAQWRKHAEVLAHNRLTIHASARSIKEYFSYWWDKGSSVPFATTTGEGHHADAIQAREYALLFAEQAWERGVLRQHGEVRFTRGQSDRQPARRNQGKPQRRSGKKTYR
jgi:hypothetical protein